MTAQKILDAIQRLDIEQGLWWRSYHSQVDDPHFEMSLEDVCGKVDLIDDERRKLVGWYLDQYGPLPGGVTETY